MQERNPPKLHSSHSSRTTSKNKSTGAALKSRSTIDRSIASIGNELSTDQSPKAKQNKASQECQLQESQFGPNRNEGQ
jgi:hypothetical protein